MVAARQKRSERSRSRPQEDIRHKPRKCKNKTWWMDLGFPSVVRRAVLDLVTAMRCPPFDQGPAGLEPDAATGCKASNDTRAPRLRDRVRGQDMSLQSRSGSSRRPDFGDFQRRFSPKRSPPPPNPDEICYVILDIASLRVTATLPL